MRVSWAYDVLAFGSLAIDALRAVAGGKRRELGLSYGLADERYAFRPPEGNVVVCFVHPQNLCGSWSGVESATAFASLWDDFAARWRRRSGAAVEDVASLMKWVERQCAGLTVGQRPFERSVLLRAVERATGRSFAFHELPPSAQTYLEAAGLGARCWDESRRAEWAHESPLTAICVLSGRSGGKKTAERGRAMTVGTADAGKSQYSIDNGNTTAELGRAMTVGTANAGKSQYHINNGNTTAEHGRAMTVDTADAGKSQYHIIGGAHPALALPGSLRLSQRCPAPRSLLCCRRSSRAPAMSIAKSRVTGKKGSTGKGSTSAQRAMLQQLPTHIAPGQQLYYVGKCPVCGDKYLSNIKAQQCGERVAHEKAGRGRAMQTLDKAATSENGERRGAKKAN